jgi:hypothetical protein
MSVEYFDFREALIEDIVCRTLTAVPGDPFKLGRDNTINKITA